MKTALKILHLEDDLKDVELAQAALAAEGIDYEPIIAADREQFVLALKEEGFDLIISDYSLPAFDGLSALALARESCPDTPFIFLSGAMGEERAIDTLKSGATDYVLKGRLARLAPAVRRALKERADQLARRQAEQSLHAEEERFRTLSTEFRTLLDAIPDKITLRTADFKIIWANKASVADLNCDVETMIGRHCFELMHNSQEPCGHCPAVESFRTSEIASAVITRPDKSVWELRTVPIFSSGSVNSVIEIARNVTEHRRLEDQYFQAQKLETVGTLASGIAHDFNNILTCISGYGQMLVQTMAEENPQRIYIDTMLEAADRAARLTKELLQFSRKQPCEQKSINLNEKIASVEKFIRKIVSENIDIIIKLTEKQLQVFADSGQLEQVLMNLATNASDAMTKYESGTLSISTDLVYLMKNETTGTPGAYALITVTDTGEGMDQRTQQRVFEPFFTTKEVGKGSGLGLAAAYGIIKQHGGEITVTSEKGIGTTFRIYLPLIAKEVQTEITSDQIHIPVGGTETILLAEDDNQLRKMARILLTDYGYSVVEAVDGEDAVNKYLENRETIDLLLFDLIMPKMNGNVACAEILKLNPTIKAIISSGYAPETEREKMMQSSGIQLVAKPYNPLKLLQVVRSMLDGKK